MAAANTAARHDLVQDAWRTRLVRRYPRWLATVDLSAVSDGWQGLVTETLDEINHLLGGEQGYPLMRITRFATVGVRLVVEIRGAPTEWASDIARIIRKAQRRAVLENEGMAMNGTLPSPMLALYPA